MWPPQTDAALETPLHTGLIVDNGNVCNIDTYRVYA